MSNICIYLPLEDYLAQWFIHEQGGEVPVHLLRGSVESKLLQTYLLSTGIGYPAALSYASLGVHS